MGTKLKVAVVGLGYFSQFHLSAWKSIDRVAIAGVTDPDQSRVAWAETGFSVRGFPDLPTLIAGCQPDIVDIVAPPAAHAELIRQLAGPGRILICQKPFCRSLSEAEETTTLAEASGATLVIHENFRFQPWYRSVRQFLDAGELGQVYQGRFSLRPGDGRGEDAYLSRQPAFRSMPRLLIHETGVHFIDLFRWLFGEIDEIYADLRRLNPVIAGEDAGLLIISHENGTKSIFDGNRLSDHPTDNPRRTMGEMAIEGEKGTLHLDGQGRLFFRAFKHASGRPVPLVAEVDEDSFGGGCVAALIRHVVDAALGDGVFENTAREYLPVVRATEAAYVSAASGCKVKL